MQKFCSVSTDTFSNLESNSCNEPLAEKKAARFNGQVGVSFHSVRNRLTDSDGACSKYVLDAIVSARILQDDNPKIIPKSPSKTQEKGKQEYVKITVRSL